MIWKRKQHSKHEDGVSPPTTIESLEQLIDAIGNAHTDLHYPCFYPYFWKNHDFYDACYIALKMCQRLDYPVGAIQVIERILDIAEAFRDDLKAYRLLPSLYLAQKWYRDGIFLPYSEEEITRFDYPNDRHTKLLLQAFEKVGHSILDPQLHLAHAAFRWGNVSRAVRIIQISLNEEERDMRYHNKGKELPAYTCLAISKMYYYGIGLGRNSRRANAWAQITLQRSTSEKVRLEAEQILARLGGMSEETPEFKLERMRLEHDLKAAEVKMEQEHQARLKAEELAHRERLAKIDAEKES